MKNLLHLSVLALAFGLSAWLFLGAAPAALAQEAEEDDHDT